MLEEALVGVDGLACFGVLGGGFRPGRRRSQRWADRVEASRLWATLGVAEGEWCDSAA